MKKILIFALLLVPMTAFSASSVRVLGNKSTTPGTLTATPATGAKTVPAKAAKVASTANSRVGTIRSKAKANAPVVKGGSVSNTTATTSSSRFPVITPAHSYNSVTKPTAAATSENTNININNYYTKDEVDEKLDDPRFDMIRISDSSPESNWVGNPLLQQRKDEGFVFMWVEE